MDIGNSKSIAEREDEGTTIHLRDAANEKQYQDDGKTKPVTLTVVGTYSTRYRRLADANRDKAMKRRGMLDGDTLEQQSLELVAGCILGWDGLTSNGQPFEYTKANAIALLSAAPWIREQVEAAMNDHASFLSRGA